MKGLITLLVVLGQGDHTVTIEIKFLVVDLPSAYNVIIGRPLMKKTNMVTTIYYLTVKFLTLTGLDTSKLIKPLHDNATSNPYI